VDRADSRPDFAILAYPVISLTEPWTHQGSKTNLLGENAPADLARSVSADLAVTQQTPPTFLLQTNADTTVPAENAIHYYLALRNSGVPAEMHIFENGPHGVGLALDNPAIGQWPTLLLNWLRTRGLVNGLSQENQKEDLGASTRLRAIIPSKLILLVERQPFAEEEVFRGGGNGPRRQRTGSGWARPRTVLSTRSWRRSSAPEKS
jgi:acetyl esterase/lipase